MWHCLFIDKDSHCYYSFSTASLHGQTSLLLLWFASVTHGNVLSMIGAPWSVVHNLWHTKEVSERGNRRIFDCDCLWRRWPRRCAVFFLAKQRRGFGRRGVAAMRHHYEWNFPGNGSSPVARWLVVVLTIKPSGWAHASLPTSPWPVPSSMQVIAHAQISIFTSSSRD